MKILFIVTQSELGGAQRFVYNASVYLAKKGYEVIVAAGGNAEEFSIFNFHLIAKQLQGAKRPVCASKNFQSPPQENLRFPTGQAISKPIRTTHLRHLKRIPGPITTLLGVWEIFRLLKKERPDFLFLNSTVAGILGSMAASLCGCKSFNPGRSAQIETRLKVIYRIGGWSFRDPRPAWQNKIILLLEKWTGRFKDKIIVNCEIDRQLALKYKIALADKIVKIYNGLDADKLEFLSKEEAGKKFDFFDTCRKSQIKTIGTVANFYKTKGLECLIGAAHILNSKFLIRNSKFVIIGDGRLRPRLERLIKKYGLENQVFLTGRIHDAYRYLKAFDVFVLPSLKEGFPWIILEAMAAEAPIIASKVGAVPEMIEDGKEGLLVEPKNSQELAEKIAYILEHPQEAETMALAAKQKLTQQFTLQKMLEKTEQLLAVKRV